MKKKKINSKKLKLNKKVVSNLDTSQITGGTGSIIIITAYCPTRLCQSQVICPSQAICPTSLVDGCPTTTFDPTFNTTDTIKTTIQNGTF